MRRITTWFAAITVLAVAACGGDTDDTAEDPSATSSTTTTVASTTTSDAAPPATEPPPTTATEVADVPPTYAFPIDPPTAASYVDDHHTYPAVDLFAECGTRVLAPVDGTVVHARTTDQWDPQTDNPALRGGLSLAILGTDGVRYYGSHYETLDVDLDDTVTAGQYVGTVGRSGNARETPCHIHFGMSPTCPGPEWQVRRGVIWPQPYLDGWRAGGQRSPAEEIRAFAEDNPQACAEAMADPTAHLAD